MQYSTTLFRKAAIEGQKKDILGEAMVLPKTSHILLTLVLILWFLMLCALLFTASFRSKATVSGWLVSSKPSINIVSKESQSFIKTVQVSNGQSVDKGDVLVEAIRTQTELVNENIKQQQHLSLKQQLGLLEKRKQILTDKHRQQVSLNAEVLKTFLAKLKANQLLEHVFKQQLEDAIVQERTLLALFKKNVIARNVFIIQKEKRQSLELKLSQQASTKLDLEQNKTSAQQKNLSNRIEFEEQINLLEGQLTSLQREMTNFQGTFSYQITSPIDGIVHNLQLEAGETINSARPLMQITPADNPVKAILYVPSNHAGFINENQAVQLKINAFPYQKFGLTTATVSYISQNILLPNQIKQAPISLSQPVFIVEAQLNKQQIEASGKAIDLKAGLLFQADIELSERSLWKWLLDPIYSLRGKL